MVNGYNYSGDVGFDHRDSKLVRQRISRRERPQQLLVAGIDHPCRDGAGAGADGRGVACLLGCIYVSHP